jgi:hypothetical protein
LVGFTGWFNSFDINNWHGSLRKMKNCNKGKSGRKDFLDHCLAEKECTFFSARDVAKNVWERSNEGRGKQEGLIVFRAGRVE